MANDIVKMVAKKAGISEPIAQIAVDTVLKFVKGKLPDGMEGILDSFLSPGSGSKTATKKSSSKKSDNPLGDIGGLLNTVGGLFGKK